ncbi:hypothetical protein S1OALGB6SA_1114 [Olavius algarvensis spirochete endosymbiont]|uniref:DUF2156 domain-containing protein n=1 Tax=Olavius algarvensis spirochete endosymbiont TaxID=260710 RepID=UPI00052BE8E1|nr:DUF2156 domain-containing protein [Olavius algarvensis spirochete endosymbiont]KGM43237.1 hypothetical protein JY97_08410 [Alkalispirochaeta odontotermitis]VDB00041.1 hypothetical protein S1OALGB6SA_1114 [Olavius algarvensis spirochete endosymbiont]
MIQTPLTLEHQGIISKKLDAVEVQLSECSYSNLYLFRDRHEYHTVETPHGFFISGVTYDGKKYLMPMASPDKTNEDCFNELKNLLCTRNWDFLFPIPQAWLECFDENEFIISSNPDDTDYLYTTEKFKTYPGKSMHKKKNLLNQFLNNNESQLIPLSSDMKSHAKEILEQWQKDSPQKFYQNDFSQCAEAIEKYQTLNLTSALAYANGKPIGLIIGEPLNKDTFVIHFAKANTEVKGVYQYLFSQFARDFCPDYQYMNLEQDLGNASLRKTKISYRPDLMVQKFRVSIK